MSISELYRGVLSPVGAPEARPSQRDTGVKPNEALKKGPSDFEKILQGKKSSEIQLSQHAETRIRSREIPWSDEIQKRVVGGIDAAEAKGAREALILADEVAVIANVKSRTIITAMDRSQMKERIFTNIDSAVLV